MAPGRRFAAALIPRLFGTNPRSHHKGATGRVRTGDQRLPVLCHCQLGQDIPSSIGSGNVEELEELLQDLDSVRLTIEKCLSRGTTVKVDDSALGAPFREASSLHSGEFSKDADEEGLQSDIQKICAIEPSVDVSKGYSSVELDNFQTKSFAAAAPDPDEESCLKQIIETLVANDQLTKKCINFEKFKDAANTVQRAKGQRVEWAGRLGLEAALARYLPVGTLSDPLVGIRMMDDTQIIEVCINFARNDLARLFKKALVVMGREKVA